METKQRNAKDELSTLDIYREYSFGMNDAVLFVTVNKRYFVEDVLMGTVREYPTYKKAAGAARMIVAFWSSC